MQSLALQTGAMFVPDQVFCNFFNYCYYDFKLYMICVDWFDAGVRFYESQRKKAGAHLFFNAFWLIPHFCINLMYMRDTLHQIDSCVIVSFLNFGPEGHSPKV